MSPTRIAVAGAAGRMGRALIAEVARTPNSAIAGVFERQGHPDLGRSVGALMDIDAPGPILVEGPVAGLESAEVLIDFTMPRATVEHAAIAAARGIALVIGTTGFSAEEEKAIAVAAEDVPIVKAGNMSLGVNLLVALVEKVARALDPSWDVEILEMHHRHKIDAPSGTALMLGHAAAAGRGIRLDPHAIPSRVGHTGARREGDIGFASLRGGSVVGEHSVVFATEHERITLTHTAEDRGIFARGAVRAALWVKGKPAGLYSMTDVLGL